MKRLITTVAAPGALLLGIAAVAFSQTAISPPGLPAVTDAAAAGDPNAATDADQREQIWNSPTMLRARAWVQEYCQASARISPEEAQQYLQELENMSPVQMKLWLLKFEHEEEGIRQQQADFQRSRQAGVAQAMSIQGATDQAYANINRDETEAAEGEETSLTAENELAADRNLQAVADRDANDWATHGPLYYGLYGGYGYLYGGYNPLGAIGAGGAHIHIHVHQ